MKLVAAKCPDCGADLKIPEGSSSVICEYCGGNILVTDVLGATSVMQNCMTLAYSAMESNNYKDAYDHFNRAIEIDMKNPNAWFGKAVCGGMIGKFRENSFGQMLDMFASAIDYAPEDRKINFRKNAAAEIVKVIKHSSSSIRFACDLITLNDDFKMSAEMTVEINKIKDTVTKSVQTAQEYDPANNDVTALLEEIKSGKFFNLDETLNVKADNVTFTGEKIQDFENKKTPQMSAPEQPPTYQTGSGKKSGCSFVILVLIIATAAGYILI